MTAVPKELQTAWPHLLTRYKVKNMKNTLFGDGIHDDFLAIQELIDNSGSYLELPMPKVTYLISSTLVLPSDFKLVLPEKAVIKLKENSNCPMLKNSWQEIENSGKYVYVGRDKIWNYVNCISPKKEHQCKNISVYGGIWDFNNLNQKPNPLRSLDFLENERYTGFGFQFFNVENLTISSLTLKNPVTFGVTMDVISDFLVENITFDYTVGNPMTINMDGIHLNGMCYNGVIRNLKGACFDDLVALNASEGYKGEISDILVQNLYAENCHSAVRLLAINEPINNVKISGVKGTYYQYCIGISKFYDVPVTEGFDNIEIENVFASKAPRTPEVFPYTDSYVYPLIWIQDNVMVKKVKIKNLYRKERVTAIPTIYIGQNTPVEELNLDNIKQENLLNVSFPLIHNKGSIKNFKLKDLSADKDEILINEGEIINL